MERRDFLKVAVAAAGTGALLATGTEMRAAFASDEAKTLAPDAEGLLYDSTLCIGCKACVAACKKANNMKPVFSEKQQMFDDPADLDANTLNIIQLYKVGPGRKDTLEGHAFIKRQCMHCTDPGCVSACPATAMTKDANTGIVSWNPKACIGCRYCMVGCPYNIPKFEWQDAFTPDIRKCELCEKREEDGTRSKRKIPACAEACPTGATICGKTTDLLAEAKKRLAVKAGTEYPYPLNSAKNTTTLAKVVGTYDSRVYGEKEGGGTQCLVISAVPAEKLGLPKMPEKSYASLSEKLQHTLYKGMIAPGILLAGLLAMAYRNTNRKGDQNHE